MLEINLNKVEKNFGFKKVLDGFDFEVTTQERVALIGPNGCGKTTILNIIVGIENVNSGMVSVRKNASMGLLSQNSPELNNDVKVIDVLTNSLKEISDLEKKLREIENKMANTSSDKLDSLLTSYGKIQELFEQMGGYEVDSKINKICNGFKIKDEILQRAFNSLSGGEKTVINLAALVLREPSILLLDEPTNHLDIEILEWFEQYLINYKGTVVISSHDRYFLDKVATKTVLIDGGKAEIFNGNYSYYLKENERRIMNEFADYKTQQKQVEAMRTAIKKLREWGKIGDNERFFKRANSIEQRLEKMELLDKPQEKKSLPLNFEVEGRSGKDVLVVEGLSIILGDKVLFDNANFYIRYGQKVGLMGKNGTGKTTLVKALLNGISITEGEMKLGSNVKIGYIPQEIIVDNPNETVLDAARQHFWGDETKLRTSLAKFLFYGENVYKRVGNLSGGEKVRLKLFELIQQKANLLILDEPTNHIDIDTREVLEESLQSYSGTILFISHDRYFINKLAQKVLNIENYKVKEYIGNYDNYKERIQKK